MRILPAAIYLAREDNTSMAEGINLMSGITHGHARSKASCYLYTMIVWNLLAGASPQEAYKSLCLDQEATSLPGMAPAEIKHFFRILAGKISQLPIVEINSDGYVINTLEAVLWCLLRNGDYRDTVLEAVNLGSDTDTTAAVVGGLAGISYGLQGIPTEWIEVLPLREEILALAEEFAEKVMAHK
jgi:ADP-ribosyl-[dinitrogen reductase] hydrolase